MKFKIKYSNDINYYYFIYKKEISTVMNNECYILYKKVLVSKTKLENLENFWHFLNKNELKHIINSSNFKLKNMMSGGAKNRITKILNET